MHLPPLPQRICCRQCESLTYSAIEDAVSRVASPSTDVEFTVKGEDRLHPLPHMEPFQ
jgi:hypothetical protein